MYVQTSTAIASGRSEGIFPRTNMSSRAAKKIEDPATTLCPGSCRIKPALNAVNRKRPYEINKNHLEILGAWTVQATTSMISAEARR
jgi:hypothetical protein